MRMRRLGPIGECKCGANMDCELSQYLYQKSSEDGFKDTFVYLSIRIICYVGIFNPIKGEEKPDSN